MEVRATTVDPITARVKLLEADVNSLPLAVQAQLDSIHNVIVECAKELHMIFKDQGTAIADYGRAIAALDALQHVELLAGTALVLPEVTRQYRMK